MDVVESSVQFSVSTTAALTINELYKTRSDAVINIAKIYATGGKRPLALYTTSGRRLGPRSLNVININNPATALQRDESPPLYF